jgi:hypothetical protein
MNSLMSTRVIQITSDASTPNVYVISDVIFDWAHTLGVKVQILEGLYYTV